MGFAEDGVIPPRTTPTRRLYDSGALPIKHRRRYAGTTLEAAFGISFTVDGGQNWVFISLHFAREGLEATAMAFKKWVESQSSRVVDRYALFKRIFGSFEIRNIGDVSSFPAEVSEGHILVKTGSADGGGQWYMTPNNTIHELGHLLDGKAGFGVKKLGSIEAAIDDVAKGGGNTLHASYQRFGMAQGKSYLREPFLLHATISSTGGKATFSAQTNPYSSEPDYNNFVPWRYLFHDIAQSRYDVWASPVYAARYGITGRIDTLVQNPGINPTETTADGFLNWVRNSFGDAPGENYAQKWRTFFSQNIGMFLRNAVIYEMGMVEFYKDIETIPQNPLANFSKSLIRTNVRLSPNTVENNILYATTTPEDILPSVVSIYGYLENENITWLLVPDGILNPSGRLVWISPTAIEITQQELDDLKENHNPVNITSIINPASSFTPIQMIIILGD